MRVFAIEVFPVTVVRQDKALLPAADMREVVPAERFDPKYGDSWSVFPTRSNLKRNVTFMNASAFLRLLLSPARFSTCR